MTVRIGRHLARIGGFIAEKNAYLSRHIICAIRKLTDNTAIYFRERSSKSYGREQMNIIFRASCRHITKPGRLRKATSLGHTPESFFYLRGLEIHGMEPNRS